MHEQNVGSRSLALGMGFPSQVFKTVAAFGSQTGDVANDGAGTTDLIGPAQALNNAAYIAPSAEEAVKGVKTGPLGCIEVIL